MIDDKKQILLNSAVKVVAEGGLENATTNAICKEAGLNEVYIYRNFKDKNHLILQAYLIENKRMMNIILSALELHNHTADSGNLEQRSRAIIHSAWQHLTSNPQICKFLVYYYQSKQFTKYALGEHNEWVEVLLSRFDMAAYRSKEDARAMLYVIFNAVYSMAKQVADGRLPNTPETEEMVFRNVYIIISACYTRG